MRSKTDCLPCYINHAHHIGHMVTDDVAKRDDLMRRVLKSVADINEDFSPPEMARDIYRIIYEVTGVADPYHDAKQASTAFARELLPTLRREVEMADDPFVMALKMVIAANIIDFGANKDYQVEETHERIEEVLHQSFAMDAVNVLRRSAEQAQSILYILDNCGEAVIDRLLLEQFGRKVTLGVRGAPTLNDVTRAELESSGLGDFPVVDTGDSTPGVSLRYASQEFLDCFNNVDLIIAKGQGNFETLSEVPRPIFFLLRVKCQVIAEHIGADLGTMQVLPSEYWPDFTG